jgi:hypothetical protein
MSKSLAAVVLVIALSPICFARRVEVLYLEAYNYASQQALLYTYNVNPQTAATLQVGPVVQVPTTSIDPLTIGSMHVLYLWNGTDLWKYNTNTQGVPQSQGSQHLTFGFPYPVISFVADPDGKSAYAGIGWRNNVYGNYAAVVLFTIDPSTGDLTNTRQVVASYGPNYYIPVTKFLFGGSGRRLYFFEDYSPAPHSCGGEYNFYDVDQKTGALGPGQPLVGWGYCGAYNTGTFSDSLTAVANAPFGRGSGTLVVDGTFIGQTITCTPSMLMFCGDEPWTLSFDPASENIFFGDVDTGLMSAGHIHFQDLQLLPTTFSIPMSDLFFSPDNKLIYGVTLNEINIYAFDPNTGDISASSLLPRTTGDVNVATATLRVK